MKTLGTKKSVMMAVVAGIAVFACNNSSFKGDTSSVHSPDSNSADLQPTSPGNAPEAACIEGDQVVFNYEASIQECMNRGRLYHFESGSCTTMEQPNFTCDFQHVFERMTQLKLNSPKLKEAQANGAKIVGCGTSNAGNTLVVQLFHPPASGKINCDYQSNAGHILTGCYKNFGSEPMIEINSKEDERAFVLGCMNGTQ